SPDYGPTGILVECVDCQSVDIAKRREIASDQCTECGSLNVTPLPYLRPRGFTIDGALPGGGRERYEGGGRERSGHTSPARLLVGQTSFATGVAQWLYAEHLYVRLRMGDLFCCNKGPDSNFPGFLICPTCGRSMDPDNLGSHRYPANVPPHIGKQKGPRA